jgi:hypothetical protein
VSIGGRHPHTELHSHGHGDAFSRATRSVLYASNENDDKHGLVVESSGTFWF